MNDNTISKKIPTYAPLVKWTQGKELKEILTSPMKSLLLLFLRGGEKIEDQSPFINFSVFDSSGGIFYSRRCRRPGDRSG